MDTRIVAIIVIFSNIFDFAVSLTCLSCDTITQPRHCRNVETCSTDEMCGAQEQFSKAGYNTYKLGCVPKNKCANGTALSGSFCSECCTGNLCNAALCKEPDYPAKRGPICYDCKFHTDQQPCRHIDFCSVDEVCSLLGVNEFGDLALTSSCKPKHSCIAPSTTPATVFVGKRSESMRRSARHVVCETCCSKDLCNLDCSAGGPCASSPCVNGVCHGNATSYNCTCHADWAGQRCDQALGIDCLDIQQKGIGTTDGVYSIKLKRTSEVIQVYCDMTSDGGGWTVFQKRFNGKVDFYRDFNTYENGFGSVSGEYWLGLKYIYEMTTGYSNELRLDLGKSTGQTAYQIYKHFFLSASPRYTLNIGSSTGTAGDGGRGLSYNNNEAFSAFDKDQDPSSNNCASKDHGGWWYNNCAYAHLNGEYVTPGTKSTYSSGEGGVTYRRWADLYSLKTTEMKFRRK